MGKVVYFLLFFLILAVPLQIMVYCPIFYDYLQAAAGTYEGLEPAHAQAEVKQIMGFFVFLEDNLEFLTADEVSHMKDVRRLFVILHIITLLAIIYVSRKRSTITVHDFHLFLRRYLVGYIVFFGLCVIFFEQAFDLFHNLLFADKTWMFPSDSALLQLFPPDFFRLFFTYSLGISFFVLVFLAWYTWLYGKS